MSKKKLTIQQRHRIAQKQNAFASQQVDGVLDGLVITRSKNQALIESTLDGERVLCTIRPDINSLVVGDRVYWQYVTSQSGVVESVQSRQTELRRFDRYGQVKVMAANITQMVIVLAAKPQPSDLLIDSYLVASELLGMRVSMVFNKIDLDVDDLAQSYQRLYEPLCHAFITNQKNKPNLEKLEQILEQQNSIFVGQSGVGKSTLIQLLLPNFAAEIATSPLSTVHEFGQHTTSNAFYFHLPFGGGIIDSPGVRSFSLGQLEPKDILWGFKEFRPFLADCKFRDCDHQSTAHCGILEALKNNRISPKRYENYVKLATQRML
jgi:ribosome biogenesis GTPase